MDKKGEKKKKLIELIKTDPYSLFLFAMNAQQTREKYTTRLVSFLRFVDIQQNTGDNDNTIQKGCKIFDEIAKKDNNWALNSILQFLQYHKERVERKVIYGYIYAPT